MNRQQCLHAAAMAVADRGLNYGQPEDNFRRIARLWTAYLQDLAPNISLEPHDAALLLDLVKTARLQNNPAHEDSWVDKAGYSACGAEVATPQSPQQRQATQDPLVSEIMRRARLDDDGA